MDADDISLPERLEKQADFLQTHPEVGVLGTGADVINAIGQHQSTMNYPLVHPLLLWELCFHCPIIHPTVMARRSLLVAAGGYRHDYPHAEDYDLWTRISEITRLANLPEPLLRLRKHGENVSIKNRPAHLKSSADISQKMILSLSGRPVPIAPLDLAWKPRRISPAELRQLSDTIRALLNHFSNFPDLTLLERRFLRRDAALQLTRLLRNSALDATAFNIFWQALECDPLAGGQILLLTFSKIAQCLKSR